MNSLERRKYRFRGVPREQKLETSTRWQKFWNIIFPWIKRKREQGELFLQAKIEQELAKAEDTYAAADLKRAEAEKLRQETKQIVENAKAKEIELIEDDKDLDSSLEEGLDDLADFIRLLRLKYGTQISIEFINLETEINTQPISISREELASRLLLLTNIEDPDEPDNFALAD